MLQRMAVSRICEADGCDRPAKDDQHRYCHAHEYRARVTGDVPRGEIRAYDLPAAEKLGAAALEYADADSEDDEVFRLAKLKLYWTARRIFEGKRRSQDQ
jgi:hypothetical protein